MKWRFKWIAALVALVTVPLTAQAQQQIEIFDAHLHYNQEPKPFYSLDQVRDIFRRNGITGIVATSRPNKGTHELV
ncbi:MAG: amidohydrolase, partial [Pseudolabrys sp.]